MARKWKHIPKIRPLSFSTLPPRPFRIGFLKIGELFYPRLVSNMITFLFGYALVTNYQDQRDEAQMVHEETRELRDQTQIEREQERESREERLRTTVRSMLSLKVKPLEERSKTWKIIANFLKNLGKSRKHSMGVQRTILKYALKRIREMRFKHKMIWCA